MNLNSSKGYIVKAILLISLTAFPICTFCQDNSYDLTIVETYSDTLSGGVGGMAIDKLGIIYTADFRENVYKVYPDGKFFSFVNFIYGSSGNVIDKKGNLFQVILRENYISLMDRQGKSKIFSEEGLKGPVGMAFNSKEELFVCNCQGNTISQYSNAGEILKTYKNELFDCPNGIIKGPDNAMYVVNFNNNKIAKIKGEEISLFAELPTSTGGHIVFMNNHFYVTAFADHQLVKVYQSGKSVIIAGTGKQGKKDGQGHQVTFTKPNGIVADASKNQLFINQRVYKDGKGYAIIRKVSFLSLAEKLYTIYSKQGLKEMTNYYKGFKKEPVHTYDDTRQQIDALADFFSKKKMLKEELVLRKIHVTHYPSSWSGHYKYGETLLKEGKISQAIALFKTALKLSPENRKVKNALKNARN